MIKRKTQISSKNRKGIFSLGKYPGKTLHRLGATLGGIWLASLALNALWPIPDQISKIDYPRGFQTKGSPIPKEKVKVLIIELSSSKERYSQSKDFNSEGSVVQSISILNFSDKKPLELLELPLELLVTLPNKKKPIKLSKIYNLGGVYLVSDVADNLLNLPSKKNKRYVVTNTEMIRDIIDALGGIDINISKALILDKQTKSQIYKYNIGSHRINGDEATEIIFPRGNGISLEDIRERRLMVYKGILGELTRITTSSEIVNLSKSIREPVNTNISNREFISLALTILSNNQSPIIRQTSLDNLETYDFKID